MKKLLGNDVTVTVTRILAGVVGVILLLIGLSILIMPEVVGTFLLSLSTTGAGINSLRADLGALFLGMGFFALLGVFSRYRWLLLVPVVFLVLVMFGRLIGVSVDPFPITTTGALVGELIFAFFLSSAVVTHALSSKPEPRPPVLKAIFNLRFLIPAAVVVVLLIIAFAARPQIGSRLWSGAISGMISQSEIEDLPDGLHVGLAGTGAPMPDSKRVGQSTFVMAGKHLFLVDCGAGSTLNLELMKVPIETAEAILLTHFHSDHIADLGELLLKSWTYGARTEPMLVMGLEGVESVVEGFNMAFRLDAKYRYAHHGDAVAPPSGAGGRAKTIMGFGEDKSTVVFQTDDLTVTAFLVDHRPVEPAVGYRFDYKGRSVVVSGDTLPTESLMSQAEGVDLLVHEAMNPEMLAVLNREASTAGQDVAASVANDILTYHTFPEEAARIARDANVGHLVMTHILPPMPAAVLHPAFAGDSDRIYKGPITIAHDGMLFSLLPGTNEIEEKWLLR
ncbi:MAG: MBL fold metallo-hydrolase [Spirochaetales bacterium]|nr:MBL fold metallo-hydrolase [Spirochaetales bacterium]